MKLRYDNTHTILNTILLKCQKKLIIFMIQITPYMSDLITEEMYNDHFSRIKSIQEQTGQLQ